MTSTYADIDAIKQRVALASRGPWEYEPDTDGNPSNGPTYHSIWNGDNECVGMTDFTDQGANDAEFASEARSDIPALIELVEELQARIERMTAS